jgi:hypothetical protein
MLTGRLMPHEYLMQAGKPEGEFYRCLLCETHLQRASGPTPWEIVPKGQSGGNSPAQSAEEPDRGSRPGRQSRL